MAHISKGKVFRAPEDCGTEIYTLRVLDDNFSYLIIDPASRDCWVVDPAEPRTVLDAVEELGIKQISGILTTHKHWDHEGGNSEIKKHFPTACIVGGPEIPNADLVVQDHEKIDITENLSITALHTPCHTTHHFCYYLQNKLSNLKSCVFTGDTLFIAGCGRFFEGDSKQMFLSLNKLMDLPLNTLIYCGHEYTENNLRFAQAVQPDNLYCKHKLDEAIKCRDSGEPTVPQTLEDEIKYNPFLRTNEDDLYRTCSSTDSTVVMHRLREMKNNFKPSSSGKERYLTWESFNAH